MSNHTAKTSIASHLWYGCRRTASAASRHCINVVCSLESSSQSNTENLRRWPNCEHSGEGYSPSLIRQDNSCSAQSYLTGSEIWYAVKDVYATLPVQAKFPVRATAVQHEGCDQQEEMNCIVTASTPLGCCSMPIICQHAHHVKLTWGLAQET